MSRQEFTQKTKVAGWQRSGGYCEKGCGTKLRPGHFRYDHIIACEFGGDNSLSNLQVICDGCDAVKTYKQDIPAIAKSNRVRARHIGAKTAKPGFRGWRKFNGEIVWKDRT